jgi:hypothetical protein
MAECQQRRLQLQPVAAPMKPVHSICCCQGGEAGSPILVRGVQRVLLTVHLPNIPAVHYACGAQRVLLHGAPHRRPVSAGGADGAPGEGEEPRGVERGAGPLRGAGATRPPDPGVDRLAAPASAGAMLALLPTASLIWHKPNLTQVCCGACKWRSDSFALLSQLAPRATLSARVDTPLLWCASIMSRSQ